MQCSHVQNEDYFQPTMRLLRYGVGTVMLELRLDTREIVTNVLTRVTFEWKE